MMQLNPSIPITWVIIFSVLVLLIFGVQLYIIFNSKISGKKKVIKVLLNSLLGFSFILFLIQPNWSRNLGSDPVLVYSNDISLDKIKSLKDSLGLKRDAKIEEYKGSGNPVYLFGQNYSELELNKLRGKSVKWIENSLINEFNYLKWKGIVRTGEIQNIIGELPVDKVTTLVLKSQNQVIKQDTLNVGQNRFEFNFPVNISGRNELRIYLNDSLVDEIRFFSIPSKPKSYSLRFSFPDPEVRVLTQYLLKKGEKVEEKIQVSKSSEIRSDLGDLDSLKVLIGDLDQLKSKSTQEEIKSGAASVLLINSQNPEIEIKELNDLFGTNFQLTRSSSDEFKLLESGVEALPYSFVPNAGQKLMFENSIAFENIGGLKVGMSLFNQTFPKYLSGDTLAYEKIWDEILSEISPNELENWKYEAPVFSNQVNKVIYNGINPELKAILLDGDSVFLQQDLVNPQTKSANFLSRKSGWVNLADSVEVFVYGENEMNAIHSELILSKFFKGQNMNQSKGDLETENIGFPDWLWLLVFLILFGLLWLEPRLNY